MLNPFKDLNDLPGLVKRSKKLLDAHFKALSAKAQKLKPAGPSLPPSSNPLVMLYTDLVKSIQKTGVTQTILNMSSAALHLVYLLEGNMYLPSGNRDIEAFVSSTSIDQADVQRIDGLRIEYAAGTQGCSTTKGGNVLGLLEEALSHLEPIVGSTAIQWFSLIEGPRDVTLVLSSHINEVDYDSEDDRFHSLETVQLDASRGTTDVSSSSTPLSVTPIVIPGCKTIDKNFSPSVHTHTPGEVLARTASPSVHECLPSLNSIPGVLSRPPPPPASTPQSAPPTGLSMRAPSSDLAGLSAVLDPPSAGTDSDQESELSDALSSPRPHPVSAQSMSLAAPPTLHQPPVPSAHETCSSTRGASEPKPSYAGSSSSSRRKPHRPKPKKAEQMPKAETRKGHKWSSHNPDFIDLTLEESDNEVWDDPLDLVLPDPMHTSEETVSYLIVGSTEKYTWRPSFHLATDLRWFNTLDAVVQRSFKREVPVKVVTYTEYLKEDPRELMGWLKTNACFVVVEAPHTNTGFTERTLREVCTIDEVMTLHDMSVPTVARTCKGTARDLLEATKLNPPRAVSALHLLLPYDFFPCLPFATDWALWMQVQGKAYCRSWDLYPVPEMRWAIASTACAHHFWHFDANGLGTFLKVETGYKFWYIAIPRNGDFTEFMKPEIMLKLELDKTNEALFDVYLLVLPPGSMLAMRSGLPHCVVTPESAICIGGHYDAVTTLTDSVVGSYHHFITSSTDPHVPDVLTWDGFLTIFFLSIYFELASALTNWNYADEGLEREFLASIKNKACARRLMYWFFSAHRLEGPATSITGLKAAETVYAQFLAHHARLLIQYKELAVQAKVKGAIPELSVKDVDAAVTACIEGGPAWDVFAEVSPQDAPGSFAWQGPAYAIHRLDVPVEYEYPFLHGYLYGDLDIAERLSLNVDKSVVQSLLNQLSKGKQATSSAGSKPAMTDAGSVLLSKRLRSTSVASDGSEEHLEEWKRPCLGLIDPRTGLPFE
ncbi:hypothetical protein DXG01_015857 [Tephrocybe rancida]|nr:hypothetical protein DXG01_015857 [Tephrocybe rancida]